MLFSNLTQRLKYIQILAYYQVSLVNKTQPRVFGPLFGNQLKAIEVGDFITEKLLSWLSMYMIHTLRYFKLVMTAFVWALSLGTVMEAYACPLSLPSTEVKVKASHLKLEIAATPEARKCGLSNRHNLPDDKGMLFVVPKPKMLSFWMANTQLQLSIAFLDAEGRVLSIQSMKPGQTQERYLSPEPARFAIEVNKGWFSRHQVEVGDTIELRLPVMMLVR